MPKEFDECVKKGGKVRRVNLDEERFMNVCIKDNKVHRGEVKRKKDDN